MDLIEELGYVSSKHILKTSVAILRYSPKTFHIITLSFIFPLSLGVLVHEYFGHADYLIYNVVSQTEVQSFKYPTFFPHHTQDFMFHMFYLLFRFSFTLLSTGSVIFTVASLYSSNSASFSSTLYAMPRVLKRLFCTFAWLLPAMVVYDLILIILDPLSSKFTVLNFLFAMVLHLFMLFLIPMCWHLASVISVVEPDVCGFAAMKKSYELLKGIFDQASELVLMYLLSFASIWLVFQSVVVFGKVLGVGLYLRILVGLLMLGLLVFVNLVGLVAESVLYYFAKSYHEQKIDRSILHEHLDEYLAGYVPITGGDDGTEMEGAEQV